MAVKYHQSENGKWNICQAKKACPLGGQHKSRAEVVSDKFRNKTGSEAFNEVSKSLETHDEVHFRVYLSSKTNEPTAICVQSFDYFDYEGKRFLESVAYKTEGEAEAAAAKFNDAKAPKGTPGKEKISKALKAYYANASKIDRSPMSEVTNQLDSWDEVHYRAYLKKNGETVAICVQNFDYYDYEAQRFLEPIAYKTEEEALEGLKKFK